MRFQKHFLAVKFLMIQMSKIQFGMIHPKKIVEDLLNALTIENNWDKKTLESVFENLMNQHNLSLGKLFPTYSICSIWTYLWSWYF
ncbi:MAG: hypothetical protein CM1200mP1_16530 [Candidatus Neomarinimicrobiota bacterium]|nr:MAG: hypothetical protein CM1200mP1_16530 [Candidatus Neomarinimicrobiota bacterium]